MCGRYKLQDPEWVEADFSTSFPTLSDAVRRPRFNVAPGQLVLAITRGEGGRALEQMDWGI
jgi:putative SOS response-associated peptidase YedK